MFVICFLVAMVCSYVIESTFHNIYCTVGITCLMGVTCGFLVAREEGRSKEE